MMQLYPMTIDGGPVDGSARFPVVNPASARPFAEAPECTAAELDLAMAAAARALATWRVDGDARSQALLRIADRLTLAVDALAPLLTREQGKPLANARGEVLQMAVWFRWYAAFQPARKVVQDDAQAYVEVLRRPVGVVAAITPWNVPLLLAAWKLAPALAAGCTVVLKPSPYTPLSTLAAGALIAAELPPGVLNVISGGNALGAWMTAHPTPRKISFTGSLPTGLAVGATAVRDLKRITLELGGNDPAILLDDVDVAAIANSLFWKAFANNGQICSAVKRLYVPRSIYASVVEALAAVAVNVRVGDGMEPGVQLGPVNNEPQRRRVGGLVAQALAGGARLVTGGRAPDRTGYFYAPTLLADVDADAAIVLEEQFGPALPMVPYDSIAEVVARANGTPFGLGASVWSADSDRAAAVALKLDCGTTWINDHLSLGPQQPFGGLRSSGIGTENGAEGWEAYTDIQVRRGPPRGPA